MKRVGSIGAVVNQIIMLFLIACLGFMLRKMGVFTDAVIKGINKTVLLVTSPAMMLMVTQKEYQPEMMEGFAQVLIVGIVAMSVGLMAVFFLYARGDRKRYRPVAAMLSAMPNAGFMGLPIIDAVYGEEGTLFLAAFIIAFNLVAWTLANALFTGLSLKSLKGLVNPGFLSTIVGVLFYVCKVVLPAPVLATVTQLGNVNTPLALLLLGARMDTLTLNSLKNAHLWITCGVKLIVFPLVVTMICHLAGMTGMPIGILLISTAMPAACFCQMFAEKFDCEVSFGSLGVSLSTILCIATIPLMMLIGQALGILS